MATAPPAAAQDAGSAIQRGLGLDRPSERPLPRVEPQPERARPTIELPPAPAPSPDDAGRLSSAPVVVLREAVVTGNTALPPEEIAAVTEPFLGRPVSAEDLVRLTNAITLLYVDRGYVNSGAVLPDQKIEEGRIRIEVVEGRLEEVQVVGNEWFRTAHLRSRLERAASVPLDVQRIEERLRLLQADERIARMDAELLPGAEPGSAVLRVRVEDRQPFHANLFFANSQAPAIGSLRGDLLLVDDNLTGSGDTLAFDFGATGGLQDYNASYELPFTRWDTRLLTHFRLSRSRIIESPFDQLDITSKSTTYGIGLAQPVYESVHTNLQLSLVGELRRSRTYLLGRPFSFSPGVQDGKANVSVIRFGQLALHRDAKQVLAARSVFSFGLPVLGANETTGSLPGGEFQSWLVQLQWVRRFESLLQTELVLRLDAQLATRPLLPLEQFAIGGFATVRGYRENEIVRDYGFVTSIEARIPVLRAFGGRFLLQVAPFYDAGQAYFLRRPTPDPVTLQSIGIGLRASVLPWLQFQVYYGHRLTDVVVPSASDLQDEGVTFAVTILPF